MEYEAFKSKCSLCDSDFTRQGMTRHIKSCLKKTMDMGQKAADAFEFGSNLINQYDFGSTTELNMRNMGRYRGAMDEKIHIVARNTQPVIPCDQCSAKPAVQICTECIWDEAGRLCADCAQTHECGEDMFLPVVNSPRTGVCAYAG